MNQTEQMRQALLAWATDLEAGRQVWIPATKLRAIEKALSGQPKSREPLIKEDLASSLMAANSLIDCLIEGKQVTAGMISITRHRIEQSLRYYQDRLLGPAEPKHGGTS
jgi:hypothetical protein